MKTVTAAQVDVAEVVDLTRQLIRFNTVNPPGNEEEAVRHLASYLAGHGIETAIELFEPGRANLIARIRGQGNAGHLVLSGHMDVVAVGEKAWEHDPFAADLVAGQIIGRGAADMKGGVAAMAVALATLARAGFTPAADLILAVSGGEERGGHGARHMAATGCLEGCCQIVVGEPTGLEVCPAMRGGIRWQITVHGKAAHSSTPHLGVSAISYVLRAALALEANPFVREPHDLLGHPIVGIAGIRSGPPSNIVPDLCTFDIGVRRIPDNDADEMEATLHQVLEDVRASSGLPVEIEVQRILAAPALETDRGHPLIQATMDAVAEVTGRAAVVRGFPGGTDALVLTPAYDAPFVIIGPGKFEQAHQTNEYVDIAELETATRVYIGIAERLLIG